MCYIQIQCSKKYTSLSIASFPDSRVEAEEAKIVVDDKNEKNRMSPCLVMDIPADPKHPPWAVTVI